MRVTKRNAREGTSFNAPRPSTSPLLLQIGLLFLTFALGFVVAQQGWYRLVIDLADRLVRHPDVTLAALFQRSDIATLTVDLDFAEYQRLLDQREQALRLGVNVSSEGDAVPASMHASDPPVDVLLRFPEGPADGLAEASWPFEVAVEGEETLLEMSRFSLTPADGKFLSTWGYMEALRQAGVLAPRVDLVRVILNGTDWGLYLLEETPTVEWLRTQGRPDSVVVGFDAGAYWQAVARLGDAVPGSGFQYATVAAGSPCNEEQDDDDLSLACSYAVEMLRGLRDGEIAPAALDVDRMAALVAQTALWRGTMELDWRSLRFAYDPSTRKLEPIATGVIFSSLAPLPDSIAAVPALQVAIVQTLALSAQPGVLPRLQDDLSAEMASFQQVLGAELGYVPLPWQALEANRATIQRQLAPDPILLATVAADGDALLLTVSNPQPFPVQIVGIDVAENAFLAADPVWVDERDRGALLQDRMGGVVIRAAINSRASCLRLRVPSNVISSPPGEVWLTARILGLEGQQVVVATWEGP